MNQRTALVTGSARGIGRSTALALLGDGFRVVGVDRQAHGGPLDVTVQADLADPRECERVLAVAGRVDVLVNNAAVFLSRPLAEVGAADFDATFAVNLRAPLLMMRGVLPQMRERRWGRIVNVSSLSARNGGWDERTLVYAASKAGLVAMTKNLGRAYAGDGITVNAVLPGAVSTPVLAQSDPADIARYEAEIPAGRLGTPEEIADLIRFLVSDAGAYITGAAIDINGGWLV